ncbi:MAG: glycosyltransferase [Vicinamibacterales bacterium]
MATVAPAPRQLLVGTAAHNSHVQNMVRALYDARALYGYFSAGVDVWRGPATSEARRWVGHRLPQLDRELSRRAVDAVPKELVHPRWRWELLRVVAGRIAPASRVEDWLWERGERDLDRLCARIVRREDVGGFFGVEHGSLDTIATARSLGKPTVVAFLSPHRRARVRWVDAEFARHPELGTPAQRRLEELAKVRDARRDDEARLADWIVSGSSFTTRSLVDAGFPAAKILTIPLGGPDPVPASTLPTERPRTLRVVYAGPVSVRKGAHYLLRAWAKTAPAGVELHFYGKPLLGDGILADARAAHGGDRLFFHGSVPASRLGQVYLDAGVLVLPTLCDGFGQVVSDALAHGLPVVTTENAGAADCIEPGVSGFVIPPADEDAIADRLTWCADHRDDLFDMRRAAIARAATWTWADFRKKFAGDLCAALDAPVAAADLRALA